MSDATCRRLAGSVCVVTEAGGGLGRCIAERLAAEGARVVAVDSDEQRGRETEVSINDAETPGEAKFVRVDVTDEAAVTGLMQAVDEEWGGIDGLVTVSPRTAGNVAGDGGDARHIDVSEQELDDALASTLKGALFCAKHAVPIMVDSERESSGGCGAIVTVAAARAPDSLGDSALEVADCVAAGGLRAFTRRAAADLAGLGVRVNALSVPSARTEADVPVDRVESAAPPAAAAFLLSPEAASVTGIDLPVGGGRPSSTAASR